MKYIAWIKIISRLATIGILYLLLTIPDSNSILKSDEIPALDSIAIRSNWSFIEEEISVFSQIHPPIQDSIVRKGMQQLTGLIDQAKNQRVSPNDELLDSINRKILLVSAHVAGSKKYVNEFLQQCISWTGFVKDQAGFWDQSLEQNRTRLFALINATREAMLAVELFSNNNETAIINVPAPQSFTSSVNFKGLKIHNGDLIISNYGSFYPYYVLGKRESGLFSTVAIVYIKDGIGKAILIAPNSGIVSVSLEEFLNKSGSPSIFLRLRSALPEIISNPKLPAEASEQTSKLLSSGIAYDYKLREESAGSLYPAQLVEQVFKDAGIDLGATYSTVSRDAFKQPLRALGIKNFNAIMPFEYLANQKLVEVGEIYNSDDVMKVIEKYSASRASLLSINKEMVKSVRWKLPFFRIEKGYSIFINLFGISGPIPKELSAQSALTYQLIKLNEIKFDKKINVERRSFYEKYHYQPGYATIKSFTQNH